MDMQTKRKLQYTIMLRYNTCQNTRKKRYTIQTEIQLWIRLV